MNRCISFSLPMSAPSESTSLFHPFAFVSWCDVLYSLHDITKSNSFVAAENEVDNSWNMMTTAQCNTWNRLFICTSHMHVMCGVCCLHTEKLVHRTDCCINLRGLLSGRLWPSIETRIPLFHFHRTWTLMRHYGKSRKIRCNDNTRFQWYGITGTDHWYDNFTERGQSWPKTRKIILFGFRLTFGVAPFVLFFCLKF